MAFGIGDFSLGDFFTMLPPPVQIVVVLALSVIFVAAVDKALDTAQLFGVTGLKEAFTLKTYMDDSGFHLGRPAVPSDRCYSLEPRQSECFTARGVTESTAVGACVETKREFFRETYNRVGDISFLSSGECMVYATADTENQLGMTYTFYNKVEWPTVWYFVTAPFGLAASSYNERSLCDAVISLCRSESEARIAAANATFTDCPDDWAARQSAYEAGCVTNGIYLFDWKIFFYGSILLMFISWVVTWYSAGGLLG